MKLSEALSVIAPALIITPRFVSIPLTFTAGVIQAFNGNILAQAPIDLQVEDFATDSARFAKVWTDSSRLHPAETFVTVRRGSTQFRLLRKDVNTTVYPQFQQASVLLSQKQIDCIQLASKFASTNALHPWACGVSITRKGIVATNNQILVFVPCEFDYQLTMPFWSFSVLSTYTDCPNIGWSAGSICFAWANGVRFQVQRLSDEMPPSVGLLASELTDASQRIPSMAEILEDLRRLEGKICTLDHNSLAIDGADGERAEADVEFAGQFKMTIETARLIFEHATHIDFDKAPDRLRFSKESYPQMVGIASGVR